MRYAKSQAAFERAKKLIPGGVNSPARAFGGVGGTPLFIARAEGAYLYDLDGRRYVDYIGSWGPMLFGHRPPAVERALLDAVQRGVSYGAPTELESEAAQLVIDLVPSVEMVRFVNSGTEATMSAVRLARGATGRNVIVKFTGNYHGHVDSLLVAAGSAAATLGVPNSPGVTPGASQDTLLLPYNDPQRLADAFSIYGDRIAGVILEPVCGNMGVVVPTAEFLASLRGLTHQYGAILIFDEVMTGFRVAAGGAQQLFGVKPDLTTLGKIVGGGLPVGAYGGRADLMKHILPSGKVFQAGTLSGNPLAMTAGVATLKLIRDQPPYERLERLTAHLEKGLLAAAAKAGVVVSSARVGSMLTLFFHPGPIPNWEAAQHADTKAFSKYFWGLMDRGSYMPCSQFEALFVSSAHTEADLDQTIAAANEVFTALSQN